MESERKLREAFAAALGLRDGVDFEGLAYRGLAEWDSVAHMQLVAKLEAAADAATVSGFYREIFRRHKRLDVLVNNAGVLVGGPLGMIAEADIARTLDANVGSALRNTQEAARLMARGGGGAIVNVSSVVA